VKARPVSLLLKLGWTTNHISQNMTIQGGILEGHRRPVGVLFGKDDILGDSLCTFKEHHFISQVLLWRVERCDMSSHIRC